MRVEHGFSREGIEGLAPVCRGVGRCSCCRWLLLVLLCGVYDRTIVMLLLLWLLSGHVHSSRLSGLLEGIRMCRRQLLSCSCGACRDHDWHTDTIWYSNHRITSIFHNIA